jgi:hypothetical protein
MMENEQEPEEFFNSASDYDDGGVLEGPGQPHPVRIHKMCDSGDNQLLVVGHFVHSPDQVEQGGMKGARED